MKAIFIIIVTLFIGVVPYKANKVPFDAFICTSELTVEKNRSFKSAYEDGASFKLTLSNTSANASAYNIKTTMLSTPCSNKTNKNTSSKSVVKNSKLNVSLNYKNANSISKNQSKNNNVIRIEAGRSKEFIINAKAPEGTPYNTWGCIKVEAIPVECKSVSSEIILSVFIPDPTGN